MGREARTHSLGDVARAGFHQLESAREGIRALAASSRQPSELLLRALSVAADPDAALARLIELSEQHRGALEGIGADGWHRAALLFGASPALGSFFARRPQRLHETLAGEGAAIGHTRARAELLAAVEAEPPDVAVTAASGQGGMFRSEPVVAGLIAEAGTVALRVRYRELLAQLMLYDLLSGVRGNASDTVDTVAASLTHLADAALEAALAVARGTLIAGGGGAPVSRAQLHATRLAVIAMGKCGAQELNVVSDVDVMFLAEAATGSVDISTETAARVGTRLAAETMRVIHDPSGEPPLWQVDTNLRPEGRQGALVRSLKSMLGYYERWAKTWEFQALLKARAAAGDRALGDTFVRDTRAMVWQSSSRDDFVGSVQRMRERVTENIDPDTLDVQLKLGPGGLRDIEFSVQLLQLVHGQHDDTVRLAGTLPALEALAQGGYIARADARQLARDYRMLRLFEHRLQLRDLRRTALMPRDENQLRVLARACQPGTTGAQLHDRWRQISAEVRQLHLKIFYAPLLSAVAALPEEDFVLGTDRARVRLQSIGFRDPDGAMRHLVSLTRGTSRTARIQRNLMPVVLRQLGEGRDPDYGLLAFRRVSEANRDTPWYLRLLRDGTEAAERLTRVLAGSRFAAELLETLPGAVAWLEHDEQLRPMPLAALCQEMRALIARRTSLEEAAEGVRAIHRREVLRLALGRLVFVIDDAEVAAGLDATHTALLDSLLLVARSPADGHTSDEHTPELCLIAMGRYGGHELGFASDIDLLAVFRTTKGRGSSPQHDAAHEQAHAERARTRAEQVIARLRKLCADPRLTVALDFGLRPEGKHGPIVRSLDAYRNYYGRWSLTWEAQALLRSRPVCGDVALGEAFEQLADSVRYPQQFDATQVREVRRMKARVEAERLPRGVDPKRHLKLGPGGISDVEWLLQLWQLQHAHALPALRTTSTRSALAAARTAGLISAAESEQLTEAWRLASSIRSAGRLWNGKVSDVLPADRSELEGIAGVLGLPPGHTSELEERWFAASRRARQIFEREFFGYDDDTRSVH